MIDAGASGVLQRQGASGLRESRVQKYIDLLIEQISAFSGMLVGQLCYRMLMYRP
jgi:hypothetical protein